MLIPRLYGLVGRRREVAGITRKTRSSGQKRFTFVAFALQILIFVRKIAHVVRHVASTVLRIRSTNRLGICVAPVPRKQACSRFMQPMRRLGLFKSIYTVPWLGRIFPGTSDVIFCISSISFLDCHPNVLKVSASYIQYLMQSARIATQIPSTGNHDTSIVNPS